MYYEAVKSAFGCFPLDPPRELVVGDYVRITWGGKVHHRGNLAKLLGIEIEIDEHVGDIEYMSNSVSKAEMGLMMPPRTQGKFAAFDEFEIVQQIAANKQTVLNATRRRLRSGRSPGSSRRAAGRRGRVGRGRGR